MPPGGPVDGGTRRRHQELLVTLEDRPSLGIDAERTAGSRHRQGSHLVEHPAGGR